MQTTYNSAIFEVNDIPQAMRIILTPEGSTTDERWKTETPYLADMIAQHFAIGPDSLVLDYGCGVGRLAHELIQRHGCRVVGVDISTSMRALAVIYARSDRFASCAPDMLDNLVARGARFDLALAIWVLQHCAAPAQDIARIRDALCPGGGLFVANADARSVPTTERGWVDDGLDVKAMLTGELDLLVEGRPAREKTTERLAKLTFWATLRRR